MAVRLKNKDLDLLSAYKKHGRQAPQTKGLEKLIIPGCLLLVVGLAYGFLMYRGHQLNAENVALTEQIAKQEAEIKDKNIRELSEELSSIKQKNDILKNVLDDLASYPEITPNIISTVSAACGDNAKIGILNFERASGQILINLEANNNDSTYKVVRALKETGLFSDVTYSGYQQNTVTSSNENGDSKEVKETIIYTSQIACWLKEVSE